MDKCFLCKSKERDDVKYGEFMTRGEISVHYFCLLLTSNLMQRGRDDEGFLGFLLPDIKAEARRVASAVCCYCKKKSSNISCCARKCHKSFHLTCGMKNNAENQFVGTFKSYCDRHVTGKKSRRPAPDETCCICYENIIDERGKFSCVTMIRAPCCKNGWFHKWCLAAFAKSAGYFFKCPLCNDSKVFRQRVVYKGVFIPDRDASWEMEPNAFAELLERPKECSAIDCRANGGRTSSNNRNKLIFCGTCGSVAIHRKCMITQTDTFYCDECTIVISAVKNSSIINISASQQMPDEEEEDIDVCGEADDAPALSNSQVQDSDEDEGTVRPLGKIRKNEFRIFDDEDVDVEDDDIYEHAHKRVTRILSLDIEDTSMPVRVKRNRGDSREAESLFDSEAESDRSGSGGDKVNAKAAISDCNSLEKLKHMVNQNLKLNQQESIKEAKKPARKFTSLNDRPNESWRTMTRTRRQSMCEELYLSSLKAEKVEKCHPVLVRRKSALTTISVTNKNHEADETKVKASASSINTDLHSKRKSFNAVNSTLKSIDSSAGVRHDIPGDDDPLNVSSIARRTRHNSLNLNVDSTNIITQSSYRPRTNSEDPSKSSPALQRIRRSSFLRSPYSTPREQGSRRATELLNSAPSKRSRSNSLLENETMPNKRLKKNSTSDENENNYQVVDMRRERRPSRGRSPLSSNLCSIYAFITPAYVKKKESAKEDTPNAAGHLLPNESIIPEVGQFFSKDKSNISQLNNMETAKAAVKAEFSNTSTSSVKMERTAPETFLHSYSLLIHSSGKTKPYKPRSKRISHSFSEKNLPCNQTRIESFFKRI